MLLSCRNSFLIGVFCFSAVTVIAQNSPPNLVFNGGFEQRSGCPNGVADLQLCDGWDNSVGSPDYFHSCGSGFGAAPVNGFGSQLPMDSAYIGLASYTSFFSGGQEVAVANLSTPLVAQEKYRVRFKTSYADSANYAVCCVGVILSSSAPPQGPYTQNLSSVELVLEESDFDTTSWFQYDGVYTAQGGEDKIYLGTFRPEADMNVVNVRPNGDPNYNIAYFYIDDVEVYEDDLVVLEEPESRKLKVVFENGRLSINETELLIEILDLSGRKASEGIGGLDVSGLNGLYIIQVSEYGVPIYTEKRVFVQ